MKRLVSHRLLTTVSALIVLMSAFVHAQTYTQLHNFDWHQEGANPNQPTLLAQGQDGSFYSTLQSQLFHDGSVFDSSLVGTILDLYDFSGPDGSTPQSGLSLGFDGNYYGTTEMGGGAGKGSVFKLGSGGVTTLYSFTDGTDGAYPWAPPIQAPNGNIYGVTYNGTNQGRIYQITPTGIFSALGAAPSETQAPLILGADGNMYGTTPYGGTYNRGTIFQLTPKGVMKIIYNINPNTDGSVPIGPVMQASDGKFYGTTSGGGTFSQGVVYQVTSAGVYKVLHNFQTTEASNSTAGLVQGSDKFLYGVSAAGGAFAFGSLFKINTTGTTFAVLHSFDTTSGAKPYSTPTLHTNGKIYGTTFTGGSPLAAYGVLYSFDNGLKPFASLVVIWSGKVGTPVGILGQGFSTATGVQFGTGPGTFSVVSDTYMVAAPAAGATTGNVTVLEPSGNLVTPQVFKVVPKISSFTPSSGTVGTSVTINGMSLTQATAVTFGGVKATSFTVNSDTKVTAVVPTGALTGKVGITTKGGSATSAATFTVN